LAPATIGALTILLGNGNGTFAMSATYPTATNINTRSVAVGDFNGDNKLDLAVGNGTSPVTASSVSIYLGNGNGTFAAPAPYPTPADSRSIAVGDFNGDNKLDLAVAGGSNNVAVLLGVGDGTFAPYLTP